MFQGDWEGVLGIQGTAVLKHCRNEWLVSEESSDGWDQGVRATLPEPQKRRQACEDETWKSWARAVKHSNLHYKVHCREEIY